MSNHNRHPPEFVEGILNTIREPLVVLDQNLAVLTASRSFYQSFRVAPETTEGQAIYSLGNGQWDIPSLRKLLAHIIAEDTTIEGFEVEHEFPVLGRRTFLLNARRVQGSGGPADAILLAMEDISERKHHEDELRRLALTDPLTGLANRNRFNAALEEALKIGRRFDLGMSLLLMDLDDFKYINDTYGHPVGDVVLQKVGEVLLDGVREVDTVARLGGDEFAVILEGTARREDAEALARRYVERLQKPMALADVSVLIGASIGIASFPDDGRKAEDLVRRADRALYRAKAVGHSSIRAYAPEMGE